MGARFGGRQLPSCSQQPYKTQGKVCGGYKQQSSSLAARGFPCSCLGVMRAWAKGAQQGRARTPNWRDFTSESGFASLPCFPKSVWCKVWRLSSPKTVLKAWQGVGPSPLTPTDPNSSPAPTPAAFKLLLGEPLPLRHLYPTASPSRTATGEQPPSFSGSPPVFAAPFATGGCQQTAPELNSPPYRETRRKSNSNW